MAKMEAKKKNETSEGDDSVEEIEETMDSEEANSGVSETEEIENPEEVKNNDVEIEEDDNPKGRLKVSQRERDEIDAVIDAFWGFVGAVKEAPRIILFFGLFLALMGATFAGWPQSFFGVEVEDKTGVWVLISDSNYDLSKDQDGLYPAYNTGDSVWVQGNLQEIQYYGPIEERLYPILGTGLENPSVAPGDGFRIIQNAELDR